MNLQDVLNIADRNMAKKSKESVDKWYSPMMQPKKMPKSNISSSKVLQFLAKKQAEEQQKTLEAQHKKEQLLALRAQSSKNNKKAKIMASRTKDNDFSKIKLTDDEVEAKKKREQELIRLKLNDKVQRMKARINLEEKEKLLPKKRKRKTKSGADITENCTKDEMQSKFTLDSINSSKDPKCADKVVKKKLPPPPVSFNELMKMAETKQFEPVVIVKKKVVEEARPLTKKEKLELERSKKKVESSSVLRQNVSKRESSKQVSNSDSSENKPTVVHLQKTTLNSSSASVTNNSHSLAAGISKKIPERKTNPIANGKPVQSSNKNISSNKVKLKESVVNKVPVDNKNRTNKLKPKAPQNGSTAPMFTAEMMAEIRNSLKAEIMKEIEEKSNKKTELIARKPDTADAKQKNGVQPRQMFRTNNPSKPLCVISRSHPSQSRSGMKPKANLPSNQSQNGRLPAIENPVTPPEKLKFHPNPYIQPRRRLLETQRSPIRVKRRVESDDEEDDDMDDFIDDDDSFIDNETHDYSATIGEIFGYDRSKYIDEDDDDIIESSFVEQMREEKQSAKLGLQEDLEDIRLENEEKKRKKLKIKKSKK